MLTVPRKHVPHDGPGEADINFEFRNNDNDRFMLHDSEGFEPARAECQVQHRNGFH